MAEAQAKPGVTTADDSMEEGEIDAAQSHWAQPRPVCDASSGRNDAEKRGRVSQNVAVVLCDSLLDVDAKRLGNVLRLLAADSGIT